MFKPPFKVFNFSSGEHWPKREKKETFQLICIGACGHASVPVLVFVRGFSCAVTEKKVCLSVSVCTDWITDTRTHRISKMCMWASCHRCADTLLGQSPRRFPFSGKPITSALSLLLAVSSFSHYPESLPLFVFFSSSLVFCFFRIFCFFLLALSSNRSARV